MAVTEAGPPRLLYESGFEGWDIQKSTYLTDYMLMVVCIFLSLVAYDKMRMSQYFLWGLLCQFSLYALFEGVGHGFGGVTHHLLDTYFEEGRVMGRSWGTSCSEWLIAWMFSVICLPLASSCCAGTAFAYGELGVGWIKLVKGIGAAVAIFEAFMVLTGQADASGTVSIVFGAVLSLVACCAACARGIKQIGILQILVGNLLRVAGFSVILFAPASCRTAGVDRRGCPYSEEFNHNAVYHCCLAVSVCLIFWGVLAKYNKDKELAYNAMLRTWSKTDRMCGC